MESFQEHSDVEKSHPIERNFFSKLFFCWFPAFIIGNYKKEIDEDDMYVTRNSHRSEYLGKKLEAVWNKEVERSKPSLLRALFTVFKYEVIAAGLLRFILDVVKISQPILISKLVSYFRSDVTDLPRQNIYLLSILLLLSSFIQVICIHHNMLLVLTLGMKIRIAICALVYRKALKLTKSALGATTVGQMVNLLSNDVGRFDFSCQFIHLLWLAPCEIIIAMVLLYILVGPTGLVGCIFLLAFVPFQPYMAKLVSQYRLKTAICTDERVRLINDIIAGIQIIKMYTWEKPFAKLVETVREKEIEEIKHISTVRAIMISLSLTLGRLSMLLCVLTFIFSGNSLTAYYVFTVASFYAFLRNSVILLFPQAVIQVAEAQVSVMRLQHLLLYEEIATKEDEDESVNQILSNMVGTEDEKKGGGDVGIVIKEAAVKLAPSSPEHLLKDVNFSAAPTQLVAVVGPVGGGKSTLLQLILKEVIPLEGFVRVTGTISYASQEPWVFGGSIRQNILFGQPYDQERYDKVIKVCALEKDISAFPNEDQFLVEERGSNLSGGQRARLNLARAVYKEADIYLLDDPLSAVDSVVGRKLFNSCICGYLGDKCVILVTHQVQYLHSTNYIYLLEDGTLRSPSSYKIMKTTNKTFMELLKVATSQEKKDQLLQTQDIGAQEIIQPSKEERATGAVSTRVYKNYIKAGGHWYKAVALFGSFITAQLFASLTDIFITTWVNVEQSKREGRGDATFWHTLLTLETAVIIYGLLVLLTVIFSIVRSMAFFNYCLKASITLHNAMLTKVIYSPMSFHSSNPSGRVLNRFSKDIGALDETLPTCMLDTLGIGLLVLAIIIVIGAINPWILLPTIVLLGIMYYIKQAFLVSSRNIKRVEAVTRSPIYTLLTSSLQGITTIRAFGAEKILIQEFDDLQDKYTSAFYMFLTASRGFGFWLDMHCVLYMALVIVSLLFIQKETFGGNIGLSLTQAVTLAGLFQWGIRQWSELENQMTSAERVQEYADLPTELEVETNVTKMNGSGENPSKNIWQETGRITFQNVYLKYNSLESYILHDLTFDIHPMEKVGIVGRTGAGKSTIIQALFRLVEVEGNILINNLDIRLIGLELLRSKISIIPQEPVLFAGTLRKNLDPFDQFVDEVLWQVLEDVELKSTVDELPSGLESKMAEGGYNFSLGQRQLLCLARAIIRNNKILVLDEATANVDPFTDEIIQNTIREKFAKCTVLTIAHRLQTIMDSDKVLVMDAGQAIEFDHPYTLLQKKGVFYSLVMETGSTMAANLEAIAEENFSKNINVNN